MPEWQKEQIVRQNMAGEEFALDVIALFRELTPEQVHLLSKMFHFMSDRETGFFVASHYEAYADAALVYHHGRCIQCAKDHAEEISKGINPHPPKEETPEGLDAAMSEAEAYAKGIDRSYPYPDGVEPHLTRDQVELMKIYSLDTAYMMDDENNVTFSHFTCKKCGMRYESPEDRAKNPVDGCRGCFLKSAHG